MCRRYGIEIEFSELNGQSVKDFADIIFIDSNTSVIDESLLSIGFDGPYFELRSSVLDDKKQTHAIIRRLKDLNVRIHKHDHCGIHVHVEHGIGMDDMERKFVLARNINRFWRTNYADVTREFKPILARREFCFQLDPWKKRSMISIHQEHPTIEFRLFNAVLNSRYIHRCVNKAHEWADQILDGM